VNEKWIVRCAGIGLVVRWATHRGALIPRERSRYPCGPLINLLRIALSEKVEDGKGVFLC